MKKWINPELNELQISNTEHGIFKKYWDGGFIGDGIISGHTTNNKSESPCFSTPTPDPTTAPGSGSSLETGGFDASSVA